MAFKTFVAGASLNAAEVNTYLAKQAVIVCTSTTRPSSPPEGMTIFETDTDRMLVYTTATTGWQPPWNVPWGRVGSAVVSSGAQGSITTEVAITGLSVTFTAVTNRLYRATLTCHTYSTVATDNIAMRLRQTSAAGTPLAISNRYVAAASNQECHSLVSEFSLTAGSQTIVPTMARGTGTGTVSVHSISVEYASRLIIEDIGPSGAPA